MSSRLTFEEYAAGIGAACAVLRDHAGRAGQDAPVATCPDWTVRDLVAHQGTIHRWATAHLRQEQDIDTEAFEAAGRAADDPLGWLDEGAEDLLRTLANSPEDLDTFFFLKDAPQPRLGWARRQCHETTVHAVDAMSASLGRAPTAAETSIEPSLAADGIDELLCGFVPRKRQRVRSERPLNAQVVAEDTGDAWTMRISDQPVVTTVGRPGDADVVVSGDAVPLYLALWNRGDDVSATDADFLPRWREQMKVVWG